MEKINVEKINMPKIEFKNVCKIFNTRRQNIVALDNINFQVKNGEFVSLIGPSGCGKSTIIRILDNIISPTSGEIFIDGQEVTQKNIKIFIRKIGFVFQQPNLFNWLTVKQNVSLPLKILHIKGKQWSERVDYLINMVGLDKYKNAYPNEISDGMKQRIGVVRSMVHDPEILLMDEPFGALDTMTREMLDLEILDIWKKTKKTIIFITHDVEEAVLVSNRAFVMTTNPGRMTNVVEIDLAYPRNLGMQKEKKFIDLEHMLTNMIGSVDLSKIK